MLCGITRFFETLVLNFKRTEKAFFLSSLSGSDSFPWFEDESSKPDKRILLLITSLDFFFLYIYIIKKQPRGEREDSECCSDIKGGKKSKSRVENKSGRAE